MSSHPTQQKSPTTWTRRNFLTSAAGVLGAMALPSAVLVGCSTTPGKKATVKIAASRGLVSTPVWNMANHAEKNGFVLEMSELFTYADQQRAAQAGQTNGATSGITNPAMIVDQSITNLKVIAGQVFGGQNLIMKTGVKADSWKELEGKKIGVVPGTYARVLFMIAAEQGGADLSKVQILNISAGATAMEALSKGDVDGFVLFSPTTDQAVTEGKGYYPAKLDIGSGSLGPANSIILANDDFLKDKNLATSVMKAYVASLRDMQDKEKFVKFGVELSGVKKEVAEEAFKHLYFSEMVDVKAITESAKLGPKFGFAKTDTSAKVGDLIDLGPLSAATGKKKEQLSGTPAEALKMVGR